MNNLLKYHYTIFGSSYDFILAAYKDIINNDNVNYLFKPLCTKNYFLNFIYKVHMSNKINSIVTLPLKNIWNRRMVNTKKNDDKKECFIFFPGTKRFDAIKYGFLEYLRLNFPDSIFVCFYQDLVHVKRNISIDEVKRLFDIVISFDHADCEKYGLIYYPLVYSEPSFVEKIQPKNDVYFFGLAKDRLSEIEKTYEILIDAGIKCDFHIVGVKKKDRKHFSTIDYCEQVNYETYIKGILNSKAILEIMQKGGYGYTLRTNEAIMYDRLLITNNQSVRSAPFYNPKCIIQFNDPSEIDINLIKSTNIPCVYNYKEKLSPMRLLEFVESCLI